MDRVFGRNLIAWHELPEAKAEAIRFYEEKVRADNPAIDEKGLALSLATIAHEMGIKPKCEVEPREEVPQIIRECFGSDLAD